MVFTAFAPAASAKAADEMAINGGESAKVLYVNEGVNHKGAETCPEGLNGNVSEYDFYVKNKPDNYKETLKFEWSSSDDKVITVGKAGLTTAVAVGKAEVICVVTDKATGNEVAKLTKKVTVKANAAEVALLNAEEWDGETVVAGTVVDLNRVMADENGNETTKRGTYVTDYTKWIADPATGVKINQSNGKFEFTEEAVAGDYLLYCQTYQSDKYNQATATSDKIVVTFVADKTFEVKQDTVTKFTMTFASPLKALGNVTVDRVFKSGSVDTTFAAAVKEVKLAEDGMSATVEMFGALANNTDYIINVDGFEAYTLTASQGAPERLAIYVDAKNVADAAELVAVTAEPATLKVALYDAKGVDVTSVMSSDASVMFTSETYSTDGSYYVNDNQIWFSKELVEVKVIAQYNSGKWENGEQVGCFSGEKVFMSYTKAPVTIVGVADYKIAGAWDKDAAKYVPLNKPATLALKLKLSEGDPKEVVDNTVTVDGVVYTISYETVTPNVAALNGNSVIFFKQGTAQFVVYASYTSNGNVVKDAIGMVSVEAKAAEGFGSATLDKTSDLISTIAPYNVAEFKVTAKTNYTADYTLTKELKVEGADQNAKDAAANGGVTVEGNVVKVNGTIVLANLNKTTATLTYKVKVEDTQELTFTVTVKKPDVDKTYISVVADGFGGNIARTVDSKDAKVGSFTVYKMSNGVKAGVQALEVYNKDAVSAGAYYFTVTKDGKDVTANVDKAALSAGKVVINFSTTEASTAISGSTVKYDLGAGNYVFTLYKGVAAGTKAVAVQQQSVAGTVTLATGSYGAAVKVAESVTGTSDAELRAAFAVKDTKGNDAKDKPFSVKATKTAADYVFVESFTFYDEVATGVYAAYDVAVGYALPIKAQ
jgi:hypothetical protein